MKRKRATGWSALLARGAKTLSRIALRAGRQAARRVVGMEARIGKPARVRSRPARGPGDWIAGVAVGAGGACRYHLYRPPGLSRAGLDQERLPLMVMLHGCTQDAKSFADSTRMNALAAREGCLVLYPEQERLANPQGCWNWFELRSGRAQAEVGLILAAIDQVCLLYRADPGRVAICGLSAGASMAALAASCHPERFQAVVMHSGVRPGAAQSTAGALAAMQGRRPLTGRLTLPSAAPAAITPATAGASLPPLLVIHGDLDRVVAPSNARATALAWVQAGGTGADGPVRESAARKVQRGQRLPMRVVDFKRRGRTLATLVEVDRLGHAWSGGAKGQPFSEAAGPDVSRMAWAFAARQFKASES